MLKAIHNRYGDTILILIQKFEKVDYRHCKAALNLNFLQFCLSFNVIPNFLQFCVANKSLLRPQAYQNYLNHLLLANINNNKKNLRALVEELSLLKTQLLCILNFVDFNCVCNIIIENSKKSILKSNYSHDNLIPGYEVNPARFSYNPNTSFACLNRRQKKSTL